MVTTWVIMLCRNGRWVSPQRMVNTTEKGLPSLSGVSDDLHRGTGYVSHVTAHPCRV